MCHCSKQRNYTFFLFWQLLPVASTPTLPASMLSPLHSPFKNFLVIFPFADPCCKCGTSFALLSGALLIYYQYPRGQSFISGSPCFFKTLQTVFLFSICLEEYSRFFPHTLFPLLQLSWQPPGGTETPSVLFICLPETTGGWFKTPLTHRKDPLGFASMRHASDYFWLH